MKKRGSQELSAVYVFSHECTNGCGCVGSHPCTNIWGYAFCVYVFSHECTNGCGYVGSLKNIAFVSKLPAAQGPYANLASKT